MLRFGPRNNDADEGDDDDENDDIIAEAGGQVELLSPPGYGGVALPPSPVSVKRRPLTGTSFADINSETVSLLSGTRPARPRRSASRAALSTAV